MLYDHAALDHATPILGEAFTALDPASGGTGNQLTARFSAWADQEGVSPTEPDCHDPGSPCTIDLRIFRSERFASVWPKIVGVRAEQARAPLTPEAWRRYWLNGYNHLRERDATRYAPTAYGLEQAIAVLAPLMRQIEADFLKASRIGRWLAEPRLWTRDPPSSATLARWLRAEALARSLAFYQPEQHVPAACMRFHSQPVSQTGTV